MIYLAHPLFLAIFPLATLAGTGTQVQVLAAASARDNPHSDSAIPIHTSNKRMRHATTRTHAHHVPRPPQARAILSTSQRSSFTVQTEADQPRSSVATPTRKYLPTIIATPADD
ncbi:hypothetical protein SAMN05216570_2133 [Dyella sp. OK004]|nr:hypothetical protein SAMN05216570_2133 [Dyella sp. OK004]